MADDVLIPKNIKVPPAPKSTSSELASLNDLIKLMNNPAITGAEVPPEEKNMVLAPTPTPVAPKPSPPPPPATPTPDQEAAIARVVGPGNRPLLVITGRAGTGKSWLQHQLLGTRNVVTGISDAADFRALRAAGAEFWHVMASEATRARRRSPAAAQRAASQLIATLEMDATNKLSKLPPGRKLKVIWNDTAPQPFAGMQNTTAFLNQVS
jgi:hypothetical protein